MHPIQYRLPLLHLEVQLTNAQPEFIPFLIGGNGLR
ncbi:Uncharacterised protein [Vibrio cholerae]|nr:Uncharacterised protein [Vibrio cholerae]